MSLWNEIILIHGQPRGDAEEGAVVEPLEEAAGGGVVAEGEDPAGVFSAEDEDPAVGVFIEKYPLPQAEVPEEYDRFGASLEEKLPTVFVVENPGQEIDVVVFIPGGGQPAGETVDGLAPENIRGTGRDDGPHDDGRAKGEQTCVVNGLHL